VDFTEAVALKYKLSWNIKDFLDQAIWSKICQRRLKQDSCSKHAQEIVSQIIQQDQDFLGMPKPFATMGKQQALFVIADFNLRCASQVIQVTDLQW
jgi:hypothetical protein